MTSAICEMNSGRLQIDDAHVVAEHVHDIELPICQSER